MKTVIGRLCLVGLLFLPVTAYALMSESEARKTVVSMLEQGESASDVIAALQADGRSLIDATIFSLVVGGQEHRTGFARAGIASANSLSEAEAVAYALIATAGATGPVAATVADALDDYRKLIDPPPTYRGSGIATGGGIPVSTSD